jgi:GT2 family glycosyltransferase
LQHIVVDAMSSDSTPLILGQYAPGYKVKIIREADRGQSDGINKGMRSARGGIVSWLNSDDFLAPGALFAVAKAFAENPNAVAVCGVGAKVDREGRLRRHVPFREFKQRRLNTALEYVQPATFYRRSAWDRVGGLDIDLHYAMDWDLLLKLSRVGRIVAIPDVLASYRDYAETKTASGGWKRMAEIAGIGRRHNGPFDLNNLSYQLRCKFVGSGMAKRIIDWATWRISYFQPILVQTWPRPDEAPTK